MALPTKESFSGFVASEPKLSATRKGTARFYARVGHEHGEWDENGNWKEFEPSFHNLVQYGKSAIRSAELFQKGDRFVAEGQVRTYEREVNGETVESSSLSGSATTVPEPPTQ